MVHYLRFQERKYISVPRPFIILEYNQNMSGLDKFDMLMALYRIDRRNKKYYMRIVYWALQLPCVNGWMLYKRHLTQKSNGKSRTEQRKESLKLLDFVLAIAESLLKVNKVVSRKRGRPSSSPQTSNPPKRRQCHTSAAPQGDVRRDCLGHWRISGKKSKCRNCEDKRSRDKTIREATSRV